MWAPVNKSVHTFNITFLHLLNSKRSEWVKSNKRKCIKNMFITFHINTYYYSLIISIWIFESVMIIGSCFGSDFTIKFIKPLIWRERRLYYLFAGCKWLPWALIHQNVGRKLKPWSKQESCFGGRDPGTNGSNGPNEHQFTALNLKMRNKQILGSNFEK